MVLRLANLTARSKTGRAAIRRMAAPALALALALSALPGCGGHGAAGLAPKGDAASPPPAAAGLLKLPAPSELAAKARHASLYDQDLLKSGAAFDATLPNANMEGDGDAGEYFPAWDPGGVHDYSGLAFAIYRFNATGYAGEPTLNWYFTTPPAAGSFWLALANFTLNRWDWFEAPAGDSLNLPALLTDYRRTADGGIFACFLFTGTTPCALNWCGIGPQQATAALSATPQAGVPPLSVSFDASGSSSPEGITKYEWDFDGDGTYDQDTGTTPTTTHDYSAGVYFPVVRVTAGGGATDTATLRVLAYNEVENNDDTASANPLPSLDQVFLWCGSSGTGTGYTGYDGDDYDYFSFNASIDDHVTFTLELDPATGDIDLALIDSDGDTLDSSSSSTAAVEVVEHTFAAGDTAPYFIRVRAYKNYSDYTLSGAKGSPPVADLTGSPDQGDPPLTVSFDASGSNDPDGYPIAKYEWDFESDGIYDQDTDNTPTTQHVYHADGIFSCTVQVTDASGLKSTASKTVVVGAVPFDEVEDNDARDATANPLPPLGFFGLRGSSGSGDGYAAYDGDTEDFFSFNAAAGDTVTFILHLDPAHGDIDLALQDSDGTVLKSSTSTTAKEQLTYLIAAADTAPFYVRVYAYRGYSDYSLDGVYGAAPMAALTGDPLYGPLPLTVNLDASGSSDDGSIVKYEWDFDGDGTYDQDTGATPTVQHIYNTEGYIQTVVRVTDNSGLSATASITIAAGITYDELEDNDTTAQANAFPAFPFNGFYGSSGSGTGYPGYDGDGIDYFSFSASLGQTVDLLMTLPPIHGDIDIKLYDSDGDELAHSTGTGATEHISYQFQAGDTAPFFLDVYKYSGFSDYSLDGSLS